MARLVIRQLTQTIAHRYRCEVYLCQRMLRAQRRIEMTMIARVSIALSDWNVSVSRRRSKRKTAALKDE